MRGRRPARNAMASFMRTLRGLAVAGLTLAATVLAPWAPVLGQSSEVRGLITGMERLRQDLDTLQRFVYSGWKPPAGATLQPAAPKETQIVGNQVAKLQVRMTELETELRNMTGRIEEAGFKIDQVRTRLDKLVGDVDFRLSEIERGLAGGQPIAAGPAGEGVVANAAPAEGATAAGLPPEGARQPGTLGTVTESDVANAEAASTAVAAVPRAAPEPEPILPRGTAQERYNFATRLLRQGDFDDAQRALQEFLGAHPDDRLAPNAQYWLGETYYVRDEFRRAAEIFLAGYQKFGDSPKAPDSLLKLGMSLAKLGETADACSTFDKVREAYRDTAATAVRLADRERERAGCD